MPTYPLQFKTTQNRTTFPLAFGREEENQDNSNHDSGNIKPINPIVIIEEKRKSDRQLLPLVKSHRYGAVEAQFFALLIALFKAKLSGRFNDVNVYGAPHLGSRTLLRQYLVSQNVANFNTEALEENAMRYLLMAWRYLNGKRGTAFLETFIRCVWGNDFKILPLYCKKDGSYPESCATLPEIAQLEHQESDYFLTSRLRVQLLDDIGYFATEIGNGLNNVLPARLMVAEIAREVTLSADLYINIGGASYSVVFATGKA